MATPDTLKDATSSPLTDINRLNQLAYGSEGNTDIQNINKSLEEQIKSLEDRYAQPNWWKVAAGFAKPQLGGFMASLGSASEALGENVEQQRSMGIPLAKMRTEMAVNSAILSKNKAVADEIQTWHAEHPNEVPPPGLVSHWGARAPDLPAVKALMAQQELSMKQQQLLATQQSTEMKLLAEERAEGRISSAEYQQRLAELRSRLNGTPSFPNNRDTSVFENSTNGTNTDQSVPPKESTPTTKPTQPTSTLDFKITPSFSNSQLNPRAVTDVEKANNERILASAKLLEEVKQRQFQNLQMVNEPVAFASANDANKDALTMLDKEPKMAAATTNMLRKAGPLASMLEKGVGISFGPYGANFNLAGIKPALYATLTPEQQNYQDRLLNNIARSVYFDLKSRGIDPEKEGAEKFGQRMLQETHIEQGLPAIHRSLAQNDIRLRHNKDLYNTINKLYPKAVQAGSLTPLHDLYTQHPELKILDRMLEKKLQGTQ